MARIPPLVVPLFLLSTAEYYFVKVPSFKKKVENAQLALNTVSGKYWESCWDDETSLQKDLAHDEELQDALWLKTAELIDQFESKRHPISTVTN